MLILYDYWRSGAAYRTRIALNLKGLDYRSVSIDLRTGRQRDADNLRRNPQGLVPTLNVDGLDLVQSPAILEWLDERFPERPLLPASVEARVVVRGMAAIIGCDIHPLNNLRVLQQLRGPLHADEAQISAWIGRWILEGFTALEQMIDRHGAGFSYGSTPTVADCYLIPQIYSAERFSIDLSAFPKILGVAAAAADHPAFIAAHPSRQADAS
jgi:maleylpyruvate isomerase